MNKATRLLQGWGLVVCITVFSIGSTYAEEGKMLTGADLKQRLSKEVYLAGWNNDEGYRYIDAYAPDGSFRSLVFAPAGGPELQSTGTWEVEGDELCIKLQDRNIGTDLPPTSMRRRCYQWQQNGEKFEQTSIGSMDKAQFFILGD